MKSALCILWVMLCIMACKQQQSSGGIPPKEALHSFRLPEGFGIELVASEPLVADPVAMEIDENGNLYVVEMHGYPMDTSGNGAVKLLRDSDGDGLPDKSIVFADHLRLPTGVMRWKKGVLVVDVPEVLYLEDTSGDGRADIRQPMLTGLALTNPQHIANTPLFGLDNWIYLAHMGTITPKVAMLFDDTGSNVRLVHAEGAPVLPPDANGRNIRFHPEKGGLEMLAGESQYGHTFDNWGHHFCVENADHIFHEVMGASYLARNPALMVADASEYISDHGDACAVYPVTINPENQLLTDRGVVTSACGITWYNGGLFPDSFNHSTFVCEPTGNLIHADKINEKGATFTASAQYAQREFLASTDGWFRPVFQYIGPDGALYVVDYYRQVIEHPEWLSEEVIRSGALYNGNDKGRIYRIAPKGTPKMNWSNEVRMGAYTTAQLVTALSSNNIWWRRNAQRLLLDRNDARAPAFLRQLLDTTQEATAVVHALWTLEGLKALDVPALQKAFRHPVAGVRENAIRLAEAHLEEWPGLANDLTALRNDPDPKVRFQLLCTLGDVFGNASVQTQEQILLQDIEDRWVQTAALANAPDGGMALLRRVLQKKPQQFSEGVALFCTNSATAVGLSGPTPDVMAIMKMATRNLAAMDAWWQTALLQGLQQAFAINSRDGLDAGAVQQALLPLFSANTEPRLRRTAVELLSAFPPGKDAIWVRAMHAAMTAAHDPAAGDAFRADALLLLSQHPDNRVMTLCRQLLDQAESPQVQQVAVRALSRQDAPAACATVVRNWSRLPITVRQASMNMFLSSVSNMHALLQAVEDKLISANDISWPQKVQLMNNDDAAVRKRARNLLAGALAQREQVYKSYLPALEIKGSIAGGRKVFERVCASCHQYEGKFGYTYGPDLGSVRNRDKASIMGDIIDPNRSIAVQYDLWQITQANGTKLSGVVHHETAASIALLQPGGQQIILPRTSIKLMEKSNESGMPVGLEASLTKEEMAHLLAWLTGKQ